MSAIFQPPVTPAANSPLQGLHDIHLPAIPDWWPLAPGWWIVLGLILLSTLFLAFYWWRKRRWQKKILEEVDKVIGQKNTDLSLQLAGLSSIMRRVALRRYPREQVANLHGQAWLKFLKHTSASRNFDLNIIQPLAEGPYQTKQGDKPLQINDPLVQSVQKWIRENLI